MTAKEATQFLAAASEAYEAFCGYNPVDDSTCLADTTCRECRAVQTLTDAVGKIAASVGDGDAGAESGRSIPGVDGVLQVDAICKGWGTEDRWDGAAGLHDVMSS